MRCVRVQYSELVYSLCTGGVQHGAGGPALESGGQPVTAPRLLLRSVRADGAGLLMVIQ